MGIVNAVLVEWGEGDVGGYFWVLDNDSINGTDDTPAWGRREGFLSLAGFTDPASARAVAREWLSTRSQPQESLVVEVEPGAEPGLGDVVTAGSHADVVTKGMSWKLDPSGELIPTPEVNSLVDEQRLRSDVAVNRAVLLSGGRSSSSAPVRVRGSRLDTGKLERVALQAWSQSGPLDPDDDDVWHDQPIPEPCRITQLELTGKPKPSGTNTSVELLVDGQSFSPAITCTMQITHDRARTFVNTPLTLFPSQVIAVKITTLGDHDDLAVIPHAVRGA